MRASRERLPAERGERSEREAPEQKSATPESPVLASEGFDPLDGFGNRALLSLLRSGRLQRKTRLSQPGDPLEHEADRAANAVVSGQSAGRLGHTQPITGEIHRMPTEEEKLAAALGLGSKPGPAAVTADTPAEPDKRTAEDIDRLSGGRNLDESTRGLMESRFGESFSDVRIHTGHRAGETADALHSRAFTVGEDIVFGEGEFAPETTEGRRLLAHELAHVVQQRQPGGSGAGEKATERDASNAAHEVVSGGSPSVRERATPGTVQKEGEFKYAPVLAWVGNMSAGTAAVFAQEPGRSDQETVGFISAPPNSELGDVSAYEHGGSTGHDILTVSVGMIGTPEKTTTSPTTRWPNIEIQVYQIAQDPPQPDQPSPPRPAPPAPRKTAPVAPPKPPPKQAPPRQTPAQPKQVPPREAPPQEAPLEQKQDNKAQPSQPATQSQTGPVDERVKKIRANLESFTFNPWWDREIVQAFRESTPAEFQQLQDALGEEGMNKVFDQLDPFLASIIGSLGPVTVGKAKLNEKRVDWLLETKGWAPDQKSFTYYWMFQTMQNSDIEDVLTLLAADSHLHDTVLSQPLMKKYLETRGIDLDKFQEVPLGFWRGAGRGLKTAGNWVVESIPAVAGAPDFRYQELPEPYRSQALESATKDFFQELETNNVAKGAASNVTLGFSDVPFAIAGAGQGLWQGGGQILSGKTGEGAETLTPVLLMILAAIAGHKLAGAKAAALEESALLAPEGAAPGSLPPLVEFRPNGKTAAGLDRFIARHASGDIFEIVIDQQTQTGQVVHVGTGATVYFENGRVVAGPAGLLPEQGGAGLPFDPFAPAGPSTTLPVLPWANAPPSPVPPILLPGAGSASGGVPLLGPWTGAPLLPLGQSPLKGLPLAPPSPGPLTPPPGMTAKELREGAALKLYRPNARVLPEKSGAYDATDGGTETLDYHVDDVKNGQPIIVISKTISGADAISIKELDVPDVKHIVDNVRLAIEKAYQGPSPAKRGWTPVPGTQDVYFKTTVINPKKLTIIIQVPGTVTPEMEAAAKAAVTKDLKYLELPPIEVYVQPIQ